MTTLSIACSPCPNDTFLFHGLATGRVALPVDGFTMHYFDIETLNQNALALCHDLTKLSVHAWLRVQEHYTPLATGAAFGFGCGPLLVSRRPLAPGEWTRLPMLFPGPLTTAYLLFRLFHPSSDPALHHFAPYHQIPARVASGEFACGAVIHESRFNHAALGLSVLSDLGETWERATGLPVPLGLCAARATFSPAFRAALAEALAESLARATRQLDPELPAFIRQFATEQDPALVARQIQAFVTGETRRMGETGRAALATLARLARERGVLHDR